jgi:signal peptidase I
MVGYVPEENLVGKARFRFFSMDEGAHFWQVWKWPSSVRWDRLFTKIE